MIIRAIIRFVIRRTTNVVAAQRIIPRRKRLPDGTPAQFPGSRQRWLARVIVLFAGYLGFVSLSVLWEAQRRSTMVIVLNVVLGIIFLAIAVSAWLYLTKLYYHENSVSFTKRSLLGAPTTMAYADIVEWSMTNRYNSYYMRLKSKDGTSVMVSHSIYRVPQLLRALIERERAGEFEDDIIRRERNIALLVAEFDTQILALEREGEKTGQDLLAEYSWWPPSVERPAARYDFYGMDSMGRRLDSAKKTVKNRATQRKKRKKGAQRRKRRNT